MGHGVRVVLLCFALVQAATAIAGERLLLERQSPYNTIRVTEDAQGLRVMRFTPDGPRQSVVKPGDPDHLEAQYARAVPVAFAFTRTPRSMLVVGLGGGTVPTFLRRRLPELEIDVVELDPVVIEVAKSHFGFREDDRLHAHAGDGRRFIEQAAARYDVVLLDAFGTEDIPYALATREFLQHVRRIVAPGGVVIGNVWRREENRLYDSMVRTYLEVFDAVYILELPGALNRLVIACPWKPSLPRAEVIRRSRALTDELRLRQDLGAIVERGFRAPGADGASGRVLTDAAPPK
jgi:spermidine synthase